MQAQSRWLLFFRRVGRLHPLLVFALMIVLPYLVVMGVLAVFGKDAAFFAFALCQALAFLVTGIWVVSVVGCCLFPLDEGESGRGVFLVVVLFWASLMVFLALGFVVVAFDGPLRSVYGLLGIVLFVVQFFVAGAAARVFARAMHIETREPVLQLASWLSFMVPVFGLFYIQPKMNRLLKQAQ